MHKLLRNALTLLCVGMALPLFSQTWTQTTSLFEAPVTSINTVTDPVTLLTTTYAAFKGTGVLVSTDGYTWTNPGNAGLAETSIERLSYINNTLYAGTHGFLFASIDGAASWASVSLGGMPFNPTIFDIALFISIDPVTQIATSILLAATDKGIYSRTGNATNWNQVGAKSFEVRKLLVIPAGPTWPAAILAGSSSNANGGGSGGDIWRSTDGVTFTRLNLTAWSFRALEQDPLTGTIYAGGRYKFFAPGGVFISHDGGQTFSAPQLSTKSISSVGFNGTTIYLGTNDGILFSSVDQGSTWQVNQNPSGKTILSLNSPFEGSDGIWRLDDQSHAVTNTVGQVSQVIPLPDDTIYRSQFFGIWSSNQGYLGLGSESSSEVNDRMIQNASGEIVITKLGVSYNLVQDPVSGLRSLVKSNLNGQRSILGLKLFSDGSILAGDWAGYVYKSVDGGYTWQKVSRTFAGLSYDFAEGQDANGNMVIYVATESKSVLESFDGAKTWVALPPFTGGNDYAVLVTPLGTLLTGSANTHNLGAILRYDPVNNVWVRSDTGIGKGQGITWLSTDGQNLYACGSTIWRSTDNGLTWATFAGGLPRFSNTYLVPIIPGRIDFFNGQLYVGVTGTGAGLWL